MAISWFVRLFFRKIECLIPGESQTRRKNSNPLLREIKENTKTVNDTAAFFRDSTEKIEKKIASINGKGDFLFKKEKG